MTSVTPFSGDDYTSKKAAVIRLLDEGKYTDKEIAKKLLTTWNYVRKIKCQHNKSQAYFGEIQAIDNTIDDYQTNDNQTHVEAVERSPVAGGLGRKINKGQGKAKKDAAYQQRQDTPHFPLDREERKKIWTDFDANKSIVEIVKAYGIAPEIIEREYRSFLRVQGISLSEMQGTIIRKINETRDYLSDRLPKENKEKFDKFH